MGGGGQRWAGRSEAGGAAQQGDTADEGTPVADGTLAMSTCSRGTASATLTAGSAGCLGAEPTAPPLPSAALDEQRL